MGAVAAEKVDLIAEAEANEDKINQKEEDVVVGNDPNFRDFARIMRIFSEHWDSVAAAVLRRPLLYQRES